MSVLSTEPDTRHARSALVLAWCGFFLTTLDVLIVNIALPRISAELGGGTRALQWVVDSYTLMFGALLLFGGNMSDRIGAKPTTIVGVSIFALTSALCTVAPDSAMLIAARGAQGAAAALMLPASMALIREAYPEPEERARALGVWAAGGAVSAAAGPLLGGLLATLGWRLVFAVNIPVCLAMIALAPRIAPSPKRHGRFDWGGQVLALIALASLIFGLIEGGSLGFTHPAVLGALATAAVGVIGFIIVEASVRHPTMPLSILRSAGMRIAVLGGFAYISAWFGTVFLISLYLQDRLALPPLLAGLVFLPAAIAGLFGNLISGPLVTKLGPRIPVAAGLSITTVGLVVMIPVIGQSSPWVVAVAVALISVGGSIAMPPLTGLVLANATGELAGIASAVHNTFRQIGGALAIAGFGALVSATTAFLQGMQLCFAIAAATTCIAALSSLRIHLGK